MACNSICERNDSLESLPAQCNVASFGIEPADVRDVNVLRWDTAHSVYRIICEEGSYVLKWFHDPVVAIEPRVYALLMSCGVPTLAVLWHSDQGLLLEDLDYSSQWRRACEADIDRSATGVALAHWYHCLHHAGRDVLAHPCLRPTWLQSWVDEINAASLSTAGAILGVRDEPAWTLAIEHAERLKSAFRDLPQTFNYNDFAVENMALSRAVQVPLRAIVFDYDQFGLGPAYSDWRNVVSVLRGASRSAFEEAYGVVDLRERILDEPLSILYGLVSASRRSQLPRWAVPLFEAVRTGELEGAIRRALEVT